MSTLFNQIKKDRIQAMKDKETAKLVTLRMLLSEIEARMKKTGDTEISDEAVKEVISSQIKKLAKEAEVYASVGQDTEKQDAEKKVLLSYLPTQLSEDEILAEIKVAVQKTADGEVKNPMAYLSTKLKGKADMKAVSVMLKSVK